MFNVVGLPSVSVGREHTCKTGDSGDTGLISVSGRCPGEWQGTPLQYSCLKNPMDRGAWQDTVHRSQKVGHDWSNIPYTYIKYDKNLADWSNRTQHSTLKYYECTIKWIILTYAYVCKIIITWKIINAALPSKVSLILKVLSSPFQGCGLM